MKQPEAIQLNCYENDTGTLTLKVDLLPDALYRWQYCKAGTAAWENVKDTSANSFTTSKPINTSQGDKYRCIIYIGDEVLYYSEAVTIGRKKRGTEDNRSQYSASQHHYQSESQRSRQEPSVEDTDGMEGHVFEEYCASILRQNGFSDVKVTQGSGDYGIDILAKKDSVTYAIQCKCYSGSVGNKAVQEAYSGKTFYNCMVAAVLTNSYFTEAAIETAKRNAVVLWDRDTLDRMIKNAAKRTRSQSRGERSGRQEQRWGDDRQQERHYAESTATDAPDFFKGCATWEQVRERYKKLMQLYHPDHDAGDEEYAKAINGQYEKLKEVFGQ